MNPIPGATKPVRSAMTFWTVQCGYAAYCANTVTVEADTLDDALDKAIAVANDNASWKALDHSGPTFIEAVAQGADADPWRDHASAVPVPERFTERGLAAVPLITVIVVGGVVQKVTFENGPARVIVRDYDTEGADPAEIDIDKYGDRCVRGDWSTEIPPAGG
jgi:hypothetical protein